MKNQKVVNPEGPYLRLKALGEGGYLLEAEVIGDNLVPLLLKKYLSKNFFYLLFASRKTGTRLLYSGSMKKLVLTDTWSVLRLKEQVADSDDDRGEVADDLSNELKDSERIFSLRMSPDGTKIFEPLEEVRLMIS